jgi:hypothetical protein
LGTLLVVGLLFVALAMMISGRPTPKTGDDPMMVPQHN